MRGFFWNQILLVYSSHHTDTLTLQFKYIIMSATVTNGGGPAHPNGESGLKLDLQANFVQIINGKSTSTKATRHGVNPATLAPLAEVPVANQDDLDNAVTAAKAAFRTWSKTPYEDRRSAVLAFADAIDSLRVEFRDLLITEQGKPVRLNMSTIHRCPCAEIDELDPTSGCRDRCGHRLDQGHG